MVQRTSNAIRLDNEGKTVNKSASGNSGNSTAGTAKSSSSSSSVTFQPNGTSKTTSSSGTTKSSSSSSSSSGKKAVTVPAGTAGTSSPKTINTSSRNSLTFSGGSGTSNSVTFSNPGTTQSQSGYNYSGGSGSSGGGGNTSYSYRDLYRNAAVDSAANNKQSYDQNDIKTYGNRETAYNFYDKTTGKSNTVYSNLTNYQDAAKAAGYDLADEGKTWVMKNATTYGVSGSSGRGTSYGASGGSYTYDQPAGGGFYGEAMRRVNNANDQYGGLQNIVRDNDEAYKYYMQGNYLPIYGQDPNTINWSEVANGTAAQNFYNNGGVTAQEPVIEQPNNNYWDSYLQKLQEGLAYNAADLAYRAPSYGETSVSEALNNAVANSAIPAYASYMQPVNAATWNYDVPETLKMQNQGYGNYTPAAAAYGDMLTSAVSDADLAMAQYWSEIAANAKSENDRQYALRQALNYRNKIA